MTNHILQYLFVIVVFTSTARACSNVLVRQVSQTRQLTTIGSISVNNPYGSIHICRSAATSVTVNAWTSPNLIANIQVETNLQVSFLRLSSTSTTPACANVEIRVPLDVFIIPVMSLLDIDGPLAHTGPIPLCAAPACDPPVEPPTTIITPPISTPSIEAPASNTPGTPTIPTDAPREPPAAATCISGAPATMCPSYNQTCQTARCSSGLCEVVMTPAGGLAASWAQTTGDCISIRCDGSGNSYHVAESTDISDDGNQCTADVCVDMRPSHPPLAVGSSCSQNGGSTCDGAGRCVECVAASNCTGIDTECQKRNCTSNVCSISYAEAGKRVSQQQAGDCQVIVCDGRGNFFNQTDDSDIPNDGNDCTIEECANGLPRRSIADLGKVCNGSLGSGVCNSSGVCVECNFASDCPGNDTECRRRACTSNVCGFASPPSGTRTTEQIAGDCKQLVCDESGSVITIIDDSDVPNDANPCTEESCQSGVPKSTPVAQGTSCGPTGESKVCDGQGTCG